MILLKDSSISDRYNKKYNNRADKVLSQYVVNPGTKYALSSVWNDLLKKYPMDKPTTVYRGMNFESKEGYEEFISEIEDGKRIKFSSISSWSPNRNTAEHFAYTQPSYMEFMDRGKMAMFDRQSKEHECISGYRGLILKTTAQIGNTVDVEKFKDAIESEMLLGPGSYEIEIEEILSHKDTVAKSDINSLMLGVSIKDIQDNRDSMFGYLDSHYNPEDFSEVARNHIVKLTFPNELKYKVDVQEPDRYTFEGKIYVNIQSVPDYILKYYNSSQIDKYKKLLKPQVEKLLSEVFTSWNNEYEIRWPRDFTKVVKMVGLYDEYIKGLRSTVGNAYNKMDARAINKLPPEERAKAIQKYQDDAVRYIKSMGGSR